MTDHALGDPTGPALAPVPELPSIVDQLFSLDDLESNDVRRAEKTARICTRPDLEADIDALEAELADLTDENGRPIHPIEDRDLSGDAGVRTALTVSEEIRALQEQMAASMRGVRMRALSADDWQAFRQRHKAAFESDDFLRNSELPRVVYEELIALCAAPPLNSPEAVAKFKSKYGINQIDELAAIAYRVNLGSGVSIPKSPASLAVLRQARRAKS